MYVMAELSKKQCPRSSANSLDGIQYAYTVQEGLIHRESEKTRHSTHVDNFVKY